MFFKQFAAPDASLSYFFGCAGQGKAVAVDVVSGDEERFVRAAEAAHVRITHVIDTHLHADHYSGGRALARRLGAAYYRRGEQPWFVLTGDTLFVGAIGRPDLLGREREMAAQLFDSLHARLLPLPDATEIYPGHQAGSACGAGLSGKPSSTIGFEKRFNAALSLPREAFVAGLLHDLPPRPPGVERMVAANAGWDDAA